MKIMLAVASSAKFVPTKIVKKLVESLPYMRDLQPRLLRMPLLKRGHFVPNLPEVDDALIRFAEKNKFSLYYGYRIRNGEKDTLNTLLMCVDEKGRVVESEKERLNHTNYYVGMKVPEADIKSRKYTVNFERTEYVMRNLES